MEANTDGTVGGSYFSLFYLVTGLDRREFQPLVVMSSDSAIIPRYIEAGIDTRIVPPPTPITTNRAWLSLPFKFVNFLWKYFITGCQLAAFIKRERIDLIHLNNSITVNHPWMMAAIIAQVPCITHERGIASDFPRSTRFLGSRMRKVVCISGAVRKNLEAAGLGHLQLTTVHNGLDADALKINRTDREVWRELGIEPRSHVVGVIGNIRRWKGQDVVVRAISSLKKQYPDIVCLLIGDWSQEDAEFREELIASIRDLELAANVIITGYQANPQDYAQLLHVWIHSSVMPEPFGRVILEGMALRKPVVASRDGGVLEIIEDGSSGLLFTPGDSDDLAARVASLLADSDYAQRIADGGHQRLLKHFQARQVVVEVTSIYRSILGA